MLMDAGAIEQLVTDRHLERITGIRRRTWQCWRARGGGPPFHRLGKGAFYRVSEVLSWIEGQRINPSGAQGA